MKTVSLSGSLRGSVGKKDAKLQRRVGKIPCVLYGGAEQIHFVADEKSFTKILFTPEVYMIKLTVDGKEYNTIFQEVQFHPVTDKLLHVDFLQLLPDKPVVIAIPVKYEGVSPGVLRGGRLEKKLRKVKIKALAKDLPDFIMINISSMDIGDSVRISDLKIDNVTFLDAPINVVVGVRTARVVVEEVVPGAEVAVEGAEGEEVVEKKRKESNPSFNNKFFKTPGECPAFLFQSPGVSNSVASMPGIPGQVRTEVVLRLYERISQADFQWPGIYAVPLD